MRGWFIEIFFPQKKLHVDLLMVYLLSCSVFDVLEVFTFCHY